MKKLHLILIIITALMLSTTACTTGPAAPQNPQPQLPDAQAPQPPTGQEPQPQPPAGQNPQPQAQSDPTILLDQTVTVPGGGGYIEVSFNASNGQIIKITLSATDPSVQPNMSLQNPDGTTADVPPIDLLPDGTNVVEIWLTQTGQYNITVFDGSNRGGMISVKVNVMN